MTEAPPPGPSDRWQLRLYIVGGTQKSARALANLRSLCDVYLPEAKVEVIDVVHDPERARNDDILVIPTLVRHLPEPVQKIIGDLSDSERVLVGLQVSVSEESYR